MKKMIVRSSIIISILINSSQAEYLITLPIEANRGGFLPNNSVILKSPNPPVWNLISPLYSEWVDSGPITGCSNWLPETNKRADGESFIQTADDCSIQQNRTKQNREQEASSLEIRNIGKIITETKLVTTSSSRSNIGTGPDCKYSKDAPRYQAILRYDGYMFYYNNVYIALADLNEKQFIKDGYIYYVGDYVTKDDIPPVWYFYEICRKPI